MSNEQQMNENRIIDVDLQNEMSTPQSPTISALTPSVRCSVRTTLTATHLFTTLW